MRIIINKKNSLHQITVDLAPAATVDDLLLALYENRSVRYHHLPFNEYQKLISVCQCSLYGDSFQTKLMPGNMLADSINDDPCYLTLEEFHEGHNQVDHCDNTHADNNTFFCQTATVANEVLSLHNQPLTIESLSRDQDEHTIDFPKS